MNLTFLTLNGKQITNIEFEIDAEGTVSITSLPCLTELDISSNRVGDDGFREIAKMSSLIILRLWRNAISDISSLPQLANLRELSLGWNYIGPSGAVHISKLKNLLSLNLSTYLLMETRIKSGMAVPERYRLSTACDNST